VGLEIRGRSWLGLGVCKVGGVGSGSDSSPWISCSAVSTISTRGDCVIQMRRTAFDQSAFSVRAAHTWNSLPTSIKDIVSYGLFKIKLKSWLKDHQACTHILQLFKTCFDLFLLNVFYELLCNLF